MDQSARKRIGDCLRQQAFWVHDQLEDADLADLPMPEEAITTFVLLGLMRDLGSDLLRVKTYSKQAEGTSTGADWEWWFGDGAGTPYIGMRVQAKKLHHDQVGPYYDFSQTAKKSKKVQIETLRASASLAGLPAIYALYNGSFKLTDFQWSCCMPASKRLFGVSMLAADRAFDLWKSGTTRLEDVGAFSRPWSCAMLCPNWLASDPIPTPFGEGPGSVLVYAADLLGGLLGVDFSTGADERTEASQVLTGAVRSWDFLPSYVRDLAVVEREEFDDERVRLSESVTRVAVFSGSMSDPENHLG